MDRQQLILATAVALFAAFLMGWLAGWLVHRLTRGQDMRHALQESERRLFDAEEARSREAASLAVRDVELTQATASLAEARAEIEELRDFIERKLARYSGSAD